MNKGFIQKLLPHFIAVVVFVVVAAIYCKPALQGQVLQQQDIVQWKAMAKNSFDYKATHGHFPLWTNGMFSGMPAYQIAMEPKVPVTPNWLYGLFNLWLPKPINFFFLACICFYFLTQVLRINPYIGIFGALAYAYVTYNPVIIAVGHDTKMQSIALLPALIASFIVVYEGKYLLGAALVAVFTALLISLNHMQIIYYTLIIAAFMTVGYAVRWIRQRNFKHLAVAGAVTIGAGLLGVMSNAVNILVTMDAAKTTIRGGTELADANSTKTGLSKSYALDYSMYKTEPFVMMVPKMYGGSSDNPEIKEDDSKTFEFFQTLPSELQQPLGSAVLSRTQDGIIYPRTYWGGIGYTSGPPYVGAIICFLALVGFFILDDKYKWWVLGASVLSIVMSWGAYFEGFNGFLLKVLPLYNKFRAPSMIIVIPTFLFCMMAVLTLQRIISDENKTDLLNRYKKGLFLTAGIFVILLFVYFSSDFSSQTDKQIAQSFEQYGAQVMEYVNKLLRALKEDRKDLFFGSLVRSFAFVAAAALIIWFSIKKNFPRWITFSLIGVLSFIDVMTVDSTYLNSQNYQENADYENNFKPSNADAQIMQDKSFYRVFDLRSGAHTAFNGGALAAYFHNLIGGYHPAKLSIYQDLAAHQLIKDNIEQQLYVAPGSIPVVNMLNTKYIILPLQQGDTAVTNPGILGAAWFVKGVRSESTAQAVMNSLTNFNPKDTAIVFAKDQKLVSYSPAANSTDTISLVKNDNDEVTYKYNSSSNRFAVFSEVFYDHGWKAYIDGKELPIVRTNYVLRGLSVPAGQNKEIKFVFHPASFYTGEKVATIAGIIVWLLIIGTAFQIYRTSKAVKA